MSRRIGGRAILLLTASLLVGCNASAGSAAAAPSAPAGGVAMSAQNTAFDRTQVGVPAGRPFQLLFENRDGAPHNVTIFDAGAEKPLFVGETFSGPGSRTCDVHPQMLGTVTAG